MLLNRVPDLATLEIFKVVAQTGSISKAARKLGMSQQSVSARMRSMEATTRLSLLTRTTTGARLTPHGQLMIEQIDRVLAAAQQLQHHIEDVAGDKRQVLEVAASQTIAEHLVPAWLMAFNRAAHPASKASEVSVHVGNTRDVITFLRNQVVELGFIESPTIPTNLSRRVIARDYLELVVAPTHPWARRKAPVSIDELARTPLVMREVGSGTRGVFEHTLAQHGVTPAPAALELGTTSAVRSAAIAGIAPSFLSSRTIDDNAVAQRLVIVPTELGRVSRPFTALWNGPVHRLSSSAQAFLLISQQRET